MEEKRKKYFFIKLSFLSYAIAIALIELDSYLPQESVYKKIISWSVAICILAGMVLVPIQYNDISPSSWLGEYDRNPPTLEELDELEREIEKRREELLQKAKNENKQE